MSENLHSLVANSFEIQNDRIKRAFDLCFSFLVLLLGAPLFLMIGLLVRCSSMGPILYSHARVGRGGQLFNCYKFRTMYPDADKRLKTILETNPLLKEEWTKTFKLKQDPRVTPIGRILRRTSLDELPQFWNVLKGDLSVVGPRPVIIEELESHLIEKAHVILSVRPGVTGLWQVSGRSNTSYAERILLDEEYIRTQSFLGDCKLILKTIPVMLLGRGSY